MDGESPPLSLIGRSSRLVDGILRGTRGTDPNRPPEARIPLRDALVVALPLAAFYGLCMGLAAGPGMAVLVAIKIPLVLLLSVLICLPSFYVFSALTGSPIRAGEALRSLGAFALLTGVIWAALAPVTGFFTLSTDPGSAFIASLHGIVLGLGMLIGLTFIGRELTGVRTAVSPPAAPPPPAPEPTSESTPGSTPGSESEAKEGEVVELTDADLPEPAPRPLSGAWPNVTTPRYPPSRRPRPEGNVSLTFFLIWVVVFAFVACQLFADFSPYLESGPFLQTEPEFFLDMIGGGATDR